VQRCVELSSWTAGLAAASAPTLNSRSVETNTGLHNETFLEYVGGALIKGALKSVLEDHEKPITPRIEIC
jgi:hypothetical protein